MSKQGLNPETTLRDVWPSLAKPGDYVRSVLGHLMACQRKHGNARIRLGSGGRGIMPCHMIMYDLPDGTRLIFNAYDGDRLYPGPVHEDGGWCRASMTVEEVRQFVGEMNGFGRGRA